MKLSNVLVVGSIAIALGQGPSQTISTNLETARWTHEKDAPADTESVMLHSDAATGGMDLLVRFPAGHIIAPHWHESNERVFVAEGQLTLVQDMGDVRLNPGGFAFLSAREIQRISCTSKTRCSFYLSWAGNPQSHAAK